MRTRRGKFRAPNVEGTNSVKFFFRKVNLGPKSRRGNCLALPHVSYGPDNQQYFHFILASNSIPFAENAKSRKIAESSISCFKFILKPKGKQKYQTNLLLLTLVVNSLNNLSHALFALMQSLTRFMS